MATLVTYWNTLRHLRPVQVYRRIWFHAVKPRVDLRPTPPPRSLQTVNWITPAQRPRSLIGPEQFKFLNETRDLANHGWDDVRVAKLWRYNLHYFDDLNAENAIERAEWQRKLLLRWVRENPPAWGTGWEPYPTSLRIVNWIKWGLNGNRLPPECASSLAVQARWLFRRAETHLLGNHLFVNAKALVFAGLFFSQSEADAWLERGLRILEREVPEQILPDGGQFELSPMYHALALEDILDLWNVTHTFPAAVPLRWRSMVAGWCETIDHMHHWLAMMCHPDGEISYFNDAARGIAPAPVELAQYAARLGFAGRTAPAEGLCHLAESGYIRIQTREAVAILDVAPIGPDYLPAHGHADTLSFELSLFGQRVFVNSGTSCYGDTPERLRQRGTPAHNTVVVNAQDSSEVWANFRVARRARPSGLRIERNGEYVVQCAHDGYRRLPGRPEHRRRWSFSEKMLVVEDQVLGDFDDAQARFHLHPAVRFDEERIGGATESESTFKLKSGRQVRLLVEGGTLRRERSTWHPEFGRSEQNICLVADFKEPVLRTRITWSDAA